MGLPDEGAWIKACVARFARLSSDGTPVAGVNNGKIIKNFVTLTETKEVTAGTDHSAPNACGDIPYPVRDPDIITRYGLELKVMYPDPELDELLTAAAAILSTPAAARTGLTANISTGSDEVKVISGGVTNADMRAVIAATGIPVGSVIGAILSANSVRIINPTTGAAATATATTTGVVTSITPVALVIGASGPTLGVASPANGVSMELWQNVYEGGNSAPFLPYGRTDFGRTYWRRGDSDFTSTRKPWRYTGFAVKNLNYGNGPWNDHIDPAPSTRTITEASAYYRTATIPTPVVGYAVVPASAP